MRTQLFNTMLLVLAIGLTGPLYAQQSTETVTKQKTKSNNTNEKSVANNPAVCVGKIRCTDGTCSISFEQETGSPGEVTSGLPTGKRMHKPFVITKELDKSSPAGAKGSNDRAGSGKVSMSDLSITITIQGRSRKLTVTNNEFTLPADCPNGTIDLIASWSWGATNSGGARCEAPFKLGVTEGEYHAINTKGTGGTR